MEMRIETKDLKYSIGQTEILQGVSISVPKGKMIGIIGPNGSGKTTLLKHIYRALPPAKETVYINNREIESYSYSESAKELTVVKQENPSDFEFTVEGMVLLGRSPYRRSFESFTKEDHEIAHKALKSIGMSDYAERSFNALSGGVGLAQNLIELAGGENIFADTDKQFLNVGIEEIITRNPDVIVVHAYTFLGDTDAQGKIDYLKNTPELAEVSAVKNNRIIVVPLFRVNPSIQNVNYVEDLAAAMYPELFE